MGSKDHATVISVAEIFHMETDPTELIPMVPSVRLGEGTLRTRFLQPTFDMSGTEE